MNRNIIKSNSAFMAIGQSAWTTGEDNIQALSLIQNCSISIANNRQKAKNIGSQDYIFNSINRAPDVDLSIGYYISPYLNNEMLFGANASSEYAPFLQNIKSQNNNIYMVIQPDDTKDAIDDFKNANQSGIQWSGYQVLGIGNCYLNKYALDFSIGSIPSASCGFSASNVRFDVLSGRSGVIPSVNNYSGNFNNVGYFDLSNFYNSLSNGYIPSDQPHTELKAPISNPKNCNFKLNSIQAGGIDLSASSNPILQSLSLNLDLQRVTQYGLGSNYPYGRKLQLPVNGTISIECLISGISSGNFSSSLIFESGYDLNFSCANTENNVSGIFQISGAKLDSAQYSMSINNNFIFNAAFSFSATETGGFWEKRDFQSSYKTWNSVTNLWQNITTIWNSL